ncbi:DUF6232 family protein [Streptomyces sp. Da 82-17]|uniref:DUF6232 family protein n=1 Tax=Streptomyces sp. Da 82-17 TaxID=3377116 RepID=UPI0038D48288
MSKRLLWVGEAYYPLQNVARVHTVTIHPRRKEAVLLFVKRVLAIVLLLVVLGLLAAAIDTANSFGEDEGGGGAGLSALVLVVAVGAFIYYLIEMLKVLGAPSYYVLAVETNGPSHAVVTSSSTELLRNIAQQIAEAIENPRAEFEVRVEKISISPKHYYYGDSVNMYGGSGNVGMAS